MSHDQLTGYFRDYWAKRHRAVALMDTREEAVFDGFMAGAIFVLNRCMVDDVPDAEAAEVFASLMTETGMHMARVITGK